MKRILLLENRKGRQAQFLDKAEIKKLRNIKGFHEPDEENCEEWFSQINRKDFNKFKGFSLLIIHKSAIKNVEIVKELDGFCSSHKIDLAFFSGGLSQIIYSNSNHQYLSINSGDFYSTYLVEFIANYIEGKSQSLLELVYKKNWKIETLLRYRMLREIIKIETNLEEKLIREEQLEEINLTQNFGIKPEDLDSEIKKIITCL